MGNTASWLSGYLFPEEQVLWHAASSGDTSGLRTAISKLTPETRRYVEWRDSCSGRTPLAQAAANGKLECAQALVEAGVNVNAKDFKGNTPLHLACRFGHGAVAKYLVHLVSVVPFEVNMRLMTPLDVARDRLRKRTENRELATSKRSIAYEECITELEKKFYIYSGWLYEKTDNLLSAASGISSLSSWKNRYCLVLQRGLPDILELALFSLKKGAARPVLPKSVILYHVQTGISEATDGKWFNRKDHAFKAQGSVLLRDGCCEERGRQVAVTHTVEFAAADAGNLELWRSFFTHHQEMLAVAQGHPYPSLPAAAQAPPPCAAASKQPEPSLPVYYTPSKECSLSQYPAERGREPHARSATSSQTSVATTMSLLRDEDEEDEQLRLAIELSLLDAQRGDRHHHAAAAPESLYPRLPVPSSSAPVWTDDEADGLSGSYTGRSDASSPSASTPSDDRSHHHPHSTTHTSSGDNTRPVVSFSRAPVTTSIGECVICFDGPQTAVCVPCGHNAMCMGCAEEVLETSCECPVCRRPIRELIKLYRV